MKTFTVVNDELYAVKKSGYKLDSNDTVHWDEEMFPNGMLSNRLNNYVDELYDLDCARLCKDENGKLYAVRYGFSKDEFVPVVWQAVVNA